MTTATTQALPLTSAALAVWPQWAQADRIEQIRLLRDLTGPEADALDRLTRNLRTLGEPSTWFGYATPTAPAETLVAGVVGAILRGLTTDEPEALARALRVNSDARRAMFAQAVREHQQRPTLPVSTPAAAAMDCEEVHLRPSLAQDDRAHNPEPTAAAPESPLVKIVSATSPTFDPFAALPSAQDEPMTTAILNNHHQNGTQAPEPKPLIVPSKRNAIDETVTEVLERHGYKVTNRIPKSLQAQIAAQCGTGVRGIEQSLVRLRQSAGVNLRRGSTPNLPTTPRAVEPETREPKPAATPSSGTHLARVLAVELAGELLHTARETETEQRSTLLLEAARLLRRIL